MQIVHYPLLAYVGHGQSPEYIKLHQSLTSYVVVGPMLVEAPALGLLIGWSFERLASSLLTVSAILLIVIWISTTFWQVLRHQALTIDYDDRRIQQLVRSNWLRTWAWTLRCILACLGWPETFLPVRLCKYAL